MSGSRALARLYAGLFLKVCFLAIRNVYRFVEFAQIIILGFPTYIIEHQQARQGILGCHASFSALRCCWWPRGRHCLRGRRHC